MAKHLISLISTKGKTPEQVTKEAWEAYLHYEKVYAQELHKLQPNLPKNSCTKTKGTYGRIIDLRPETLPKKLAISQSPDTAADLPAQ